MKIQGDFVEAEHISFDEQLNDLDVDAADFDERVEKLLVELAEHMDKVDLGIVPVAAVHLGTSGWGSSCRHTARPPLPLYPQSADNQEEF